ncbi:MAG: ATP-utilizing enzyme of the PP-loop superfamily (Modular protein) [Candidatus Woesebacteria bacterium GW2011_GWA1_37_8]|uniref:ATP-utilizing enzyme of the PP-loop superfamily (Modular protein) n=2 Tax=Candidatus Woeseibacteriota TaxID=1752722 RepID=A0A0G0HXD0_9BACT|nr:MAG: ATP-utilizing enzyme of the PP-loop superfamily (Modular protein) [Candidatus Woesebacteria bacterium GW2011_GWA1_37_8]
MIKIFTDGGSRGNPGPAASAFVVFENNKILTKEGKFLGNATNNIAEYSALLLAVEWLNKNKLTENIKFFLDSELIVKQLNKTYKIKNKNLKIIFLRINKLLDEGFEGSSFIHVPRGQNKLADELVNKILDENMKISRSRGTFL